MDDPIDFVFVIIPVYSDVIMASLRKTAEKGTHFVADLSELSSCTSETEIAGEEYHYAVCCA